jgi:hypothetical protein
MQKTNSKTQISIDDINKNKINSVKNDNEEMKSKTSIPTIYRQSSNSTLYQSETTNKSQRPKTAMVHNQKYVNPPPSRLNSPRIKPTHFPSPSPKKKSYQIDSPSNLPYQHLQSTMSSESSTYSRTIYAGRSISAVVHRSVPRSNDSACSIREAKGAASRYNKPEELFGLRPEELFAPEQYQPRILDQRSTPKANESRRSKRSHLQKQQHFWQQDVDRIIDLYNIHHTANYRKSAVPPLSSSSGHYGSQTDTLTDLNQSGRIRQASITKNSSTNSKQSANPKQSTFALLNIPRRNSISRPSIKLTNNA